MTDQPRTASGCEEVAIIDRVTLILSRKSVFDLFQILLIGMKWRLHGVSALRLKLIRFKAMRFHYIPAANVKFIIGLHTRRCLRKIIFCYGLEYTVKLYAY